MVFDAGRFAPGTLAGQRLIAHELTHVMQQSGSDANRFSQSDGKRERSPICRTFGNMPMQVQRKTSCACGGGCPRCTSKTGSANAMAEQFLSPMVLLQASGRAGHLLQAKLTIGASNDPLEQEADRVADQVLAAPANPAVSGAPPHIQRSPGQASAPADTAPASVDHVLAGPGRPLDPALRQDMEQRFGYDFSRVRVHSGAAAEQSAREVNANAYTVGHDIVFRAGRFAPGTHEGRRLLAHELTHVVQQSGLEGISAGQSNEKRGLSPTHSRIQRQPEGAPRRSRLNSKARTAPCGTASRSRSGRRSLKPIPDPGPFRASQCHPGLPAGGHARVQENPHERRTSGSLRQEHRPATGHRARSGRSSDRCGGGGGRSHRARRPGRSRRRECSRDDGDRASSTCGCEGRDSGGGTNCRGRDSGGRGASGSVHRCCGASGRGCYIRPAGGDHGIPLVPLEDFSGKVDCGRLRPPRGSTSDLYRGLPPSVGTEAPDRSPGIPPCRARGPVSVSPSSTATAT